MKQNITNDFIETKENQINKDKVILDKMMKENGIIPKAMQLMGKRSGSVSTFMNYRNQVFEGGPLNNKEKF